MDQNDISIYVDEATCVGCTTCVHRCPTEAIRVRDGMAVIMRERCIDCGECIRVCPQGAMKAAVSRLNEVLSRFRYTIALPSPGLYGQFRHPYGRCQIIAGLRALGFDEVFEVSNAAEALTVLTRKELAAGHVPHPVITTACPVILRLIRIRFPSLLPHLLPFRSPMEVAARWSRKRAIEKTGLESKDIGCIFISPCPAKQTSARHPLGTDRSTVDAVVAISELVPRLTLAIRSHAEAEDCVLHSGAMGISWDISGGQATATLESNHLSASGMENIIRILEALEDEKLTHVDLIELNACSPGCVGGVLTAENPYIARTRINYLMRNAGHAAPLEDCPWDDMRWENTPTPSPVLQLDSDVATALEKMDQIRELNEKLPKIDCGACGAPSCRAFAEDIVAGRARLDMCVFVERNLLRKELAERRKLHDRP